MMMKDAHDAALVWRLSELGRAEIAVVGCKNGSHGEMIGKLKEARIQVSGGGATAAAAYRQLLKADGLVERMAVQLGELTAAPTAPRWLASSRPVSP